MYALDIPQSVSFFFCEIHMSFKSSFFFVELRRPAFFHICRVSTQPCIIQSAELEVQNNHSGQGCSRIYTSLEHKLVKFLSFVKYTDS